MDKNALLSRLGSMVSLPVALLLVIFFFLPWLEINCAGMGKIGTSSGLQITTGNMTSNLPENMGQQGKGVNVEKKDPGEDINARPWAILGLIVPIGILAVAGASLAGKLTAANSGGIIAVMALVGLLVMILAANINYVDDMIEAQKDKQEQQSAGANSAMQANMQKQMEDQMKQAMKTEGTGILWTSIVFYALLFLAGLANPLIAKNLPASARLQKFTSRADAPQEGQKSPPPPQPEQEPPQIGPEISPPTERKQQPPDEQP